MFAINEDKSIYATRGDAVAFSVSAEDGEEAYVFQPGDVVRFQIMAKGNAGTVYLRKDFAIDAQTTSVNIALTKDEMKFGPLLSKPTDYWYEVELNPETVTQTFIGYDEDGPKVFRLYPEGEDEV